MTLMENSKQLTENEKIVLAKLKKHRLDNSELGLIDNIRNLFSLDELYADTAFKDAYLELDNQGELNVLIAFVTWLSTDETVNNNQE